MRLHLARLQADAAAWRGIALHGTSLKPKVLFRKDLHDRTLWRRGEERRRRLWAGVGFGGLPFEQTSVATAVEYHEAEEVVEDVAFIALTQNSDVTVRETACEKMMQRSRGGQRGGGGEKLTKRLCNTQ